MPVGPRAAVLAMCGLLWAHVGWASETIAVPSNPIPTASGARPAPGPLSGELTLPGRTGPYPVVILLHGCGGLGTGVQMRRWVDRVNEWGYAAFVLDSFLARHIASVCAPADQPKVTGLDRAGDVLNAAVVLSGHAGIDPHRIGVIGFSHGGGTVVTLTRRAFEAFSPGLIKAVVNYYGPCRDPQFHGRTPMLSLNGDADTWGPPAATCAAFDAAMRPDQPVDLHTYPDVVHAFDNPDLIPGRSNQGHPMRYDWQAAKDSFVRTHAFLDQYVRDAH